MKLIINISEADYNTYKHFGDKGSYTERIIAKGVPYEERPKGKWHNIKENANDLPTKTAWYVCKVKSSHDLRLVFGYEDVTIDKFDAWLKVREDYDE